MSIVFDINSEDITMTLSCHMQVDGRTHVPNILESPQDSHLNLYFHRNLYFIWIHKWWAYIMLNKCRTIMSFKADNTLKPSTSLM